MEGLKLNELRMQAILSTEIQHIGKQCTELAHMSKKLHIRTLYINQKNTKITTKLMNTERGGS